MEYRKHGTAVKKVFPEYVISQLRPEGWAGAGQEKRVLQEERGAHAKALESRQTWVWGRNSTPALWAEPSDQGKGHRLRLQGAARAVPLEGDWARLWENPN